MKKINEGYCAELFLTDDGCLLKLYKPSWNPSAVRLEYENAKTVHALGLPSPQVFSLAALDGRYGFFMEMVEGSTMLQKIQQHPLGAFFYASQMAKLHFQIHQTAASGLPCQKEAYRRRLLDTSLPQEAKARLLSMLDGLASQQTVCHGDFHPMNILFRRKSPVVIDWAYASSGDPRADVAGTYLITQLLSSTSASRNPFEKWLYDRFTPAFAEHYLQTYLHLSGCTRQEVLQWVPLRAATYLNLGLPNPIEKKLFRICTENYHG